jgi:hypothetical membrane protein
MSKTQLQCAAVSIAFVLTAISALGWKLNAFALYAIGIVGGIVTLAVTGPHGGTGVQELIGGCVFVAVNLISYWFLARFILRRLFRIES